MKSRFSLKILIILSIYHFSFCDEIYELFSKAKQNYLIEKAESTTEKVYNFDLNSLKASRYVNFNLNSSFSRVKTQLTQPYNITTINISNAVDVFNKTKYQANVVLAEKQKQLTLTKKEKENLFYRILTLYTQIHTLQELIKLQQEKISIVEEIKKSVEEAVKSDIMPKIELNNWEYQLTTEKILLLKYQEELNLFTLNLKNLCGENVNLNSNLDFPKKEEVDNLYSERDKLITNSPDFQTLNYESSILKYQFEKEKMYWLPDLNLFVEHQWNKDPTGNGNQFIYGLSLNMNLFNPSVKYRLLSLENRKNIVEITKTQKVIDLTEYINTTFSKLYTNLEVIQMLKEKINIAKDNFNRYVVAYKMKMADFITLNKYYNDYSASSQEYIKTKYEILFNYNLLKHQITGDIYQ